MNILQRAVLTALLLAAVLCVQSQSLSKSDFLSPPRSARPSTYWMWMNGNISKEGLTQDLEQMHRANYGAAMMFNAGVGIPRGPIDYASPAWNELTLHAVKEAERLGMELYLQNSPGYSGTGGPWMRPEESMQQLEWTEEIAIPDKKGIISLTLPRPYAKMNYYRDAMVLAYPSLEEETTTWAHLITRVLLNGKEVDKAFLTDNDLGTQIRLQKEEVLIVELSTPFCAEAVTELKIAVTNLYPNRMIGDEHLPEKYNYDEYGRIRQFPVWYTSSEPDTDRQRILFSPWKHYTKEEPLLEAGLLGPVRLVIEEGK